MGRGSWPENGRRLLHAGFYDYPIRSLASHGSVHLTSQSRIRTSVYGREASPRGLSRLRGKERNRMLERAGGILEFLLGKIHIGGKSPRARNLMHRGTQRIVIASTFDEKYPHIRVDSFVRDQFSESSAIPNFGVIADSRQRIADAQFQ